ncbi:MAG: gliding motility-associated ABC transporter substrate-binding protein GldG [Schleiferiaceae bacterium]
MLSLARREFASFFQSATGVLVLSVYLGLNAVFLWLMPGSFHLLESGYAQLDGLFMLAPWVFLFLVPALAMRMLAEERRAGTLDWLRAKPLTHAHIVVGKWLAGMALLGLALIPTLLYAASLYVLGNPVGNLDFGSTAGSYLGLFILGGAYLAISLFFSASTDNSIVAFVGGAAGSLALYAGFEAFVDLPSIANRGLYLLQWGISEHYTSMSRGVIDANDVLYFAGLTALFLGGARLMLEPRKDLKRALPVLVALAAVALSTWRPVYLRLDLTEDQRFSLNEATEALIDQVEEPLLVTVYLDGEFPAGFQRLQAETLRLLDEFRARNRNIRYELINPSENPDPQVRRDTYTQLRNLGLGAIQLEVQEADGVKTQQVFPGAVVSYAERQWPVSLLLEQFAQAPEAQINGSIQNLEYALASALRGLLQTERKRVALIDGHGELEAVQTAALELNLRKSYDVYRFNLREFPIDSTTGEPSLTMQVRRLNSFDGIIMAKPRESFTDLDRWLLDQYLMNNGRAIWMIEAVHAEMDSLSYAPEFLAYPTLDYIGLDGPLFTYGARVNTTLAADLVCAGVNDQRSVRPWVYFPLMLPQSEHPIVKNLNAVRYELGATVDTIRVPGVRKTVLLQTSPYSRRRPAPTQVSLAELYNEPVKALYTEGPLATAVLLEGALPSYFANRMVPITELPAPPAAATDAKLLVVGDGDLAKNQRNVVNNDIPRGAPLPLGYDQFTGQQFGNSDFLLNAMDYLLEGTGLISVRGRDVSLRLLDRPKVESGKLFYQTLNSVAPVAVVLLLHALYRGLRRRRYGKPANHA